MTGYSYSLLLDVGTIDTAPLLHPHYQQQLNTILRGGTAKSTRRAYARNVIYF
jgi:hypothetical protein